MDAKKLGFRVVFAASEDTDYPAAELNYHSPQTRGWQSARFCEYPQEIGLAFVDGIVSLTQVQLLSHQSKIATRIELFVGQGETYFDATWVRLGYLSLDSNERSQFKARELKSVFLSKAQGSFLKLILLKPYLNPLNLFNQVGLVAVNCLGTTATSLKGAEEPAALAALPKRGAPAASAGVLDLSLSLSLDPETAALLREVAARKEAAVKEEDFPLAKRLKSLQDSIKEVGSTLGRLVGEKAVAVGEEDYDKAASLKAEIERIRAGLEEKMLDAGLRVRPGPARGAGGPRFNPPMAGGGGGGGGGGAGNSARGPAPPHFSESSSGYADRRGPDSYGDERRGGGGIGYDSYPGPSGSGSPGGGYGGSSSGGGGGIIDERPIRPAPRGQGHPQDQEEDDGGAGDGASNSGSPRPDQQGPPHNNSRFAAASMARPGSRALRPANTSLSLEEAISKDIPVPSKASSAATSTRRPLSGGGDDATAPDTGRSGAPDNDAGSASSSSAAGGGGGMGLDEESGGGGGGPAGYTGPRADAVALSGVEGAGDLPAPEPLTLGAAKEAGPLIDLFGMYVAQCFYSKHWSLREAAVKKMALELPKLASSQAAPPQAIFAACIHTATLVTAREKIAHVFVAVGTQLVPALLQACNLRRGEAVGGGAGGGGGGPLDSLMLGLADKLGDNTPRVRDAAIAALLSLAKHESVGCGYVVGWVVRRMTKKQASSIRSLQSRLQLSAQLIDQAHALSPIGGLSPEMLVHYCSEHGCFQHASGDIRKATEELFTSVFKVVGAQALLPLLAPHLRPKQQDEYASAFNAAKPGSVPVGGGGFGIQGGAGGGAGSGGPAGGGAAPRAGGGGPSGGGGGGGGGGGSSARGANAGRGGKPGGAPSPGGHGAGPSGAEGDGTCQFCGGCGPNATEAQLDLHYFRDCPMLTTCNACSQVVEIATLQEHLLEECEKKSSYAPCPSCGGAFPSKEVEGHVRAGTCRPAPDPAVGCRCPLCQSDIPSEKENGWVKHLLLNPNGSGGCPKNPRTNRPAGGGGGVVKPRQR